MRQKHVLPLLFIMSLLSSCGAQEEVIVIHHESVPQPEIKLLTEQNSLEEIFQALPEEYCPASAKFPLRVLDEANYFIASGEESQCEFTVFINPNGDFWDRIYGISWIEAGKHDTQFLKYYKQGKWVKPGNLNLNELDETHIQLPQYNATIEYLSSQTNTVVDRLTWNGYRFMTQDEVNSNCPYSFNPENRENYSLIQPQNDSFYVEQLDLSFSIPENMEYHPFWNADLGSVSFGPTKDSACLAFGDGINPSLRIEEYTPPGELENIEINGRKYEQYTEPYLGGTSLVTLFFEWNAQSYSATYSENPVIPQKELLLAVLKTLK